MRFAILNIYLYLFCTHNDNNKLFQKFRFQKYFYNTQNYLWVHYIYMLYNIYFM